MWRKLKCLFSIHVYVEIGRYGPLVAGRNFENIYYRCIYCGSLHDITRLIKEEEKKNV